MVKLQVVAMGGKEAKAKLAKQIKLPQPGWYRKETMGKKVVL